MCKLYLKTYTQIFKTTENKGNIYGVTVEDRGQNIGLTIGFKLHMHIKISIIITKRKN